MTRKKPGARSSRITAQELVQRDSDAASAVYRCLFWGIGVAQNRPLAKLVQDLADGTVARKGGQERSTG
jgi:hypothetical protein